MLFVSGCSKESTTNSLLINDKSPKINSTERKEAKKDGKDIDSYDDIWSRIFDQYLLQEYDNPRIDHEIKFLLRDPSFLTTVQKRAEPYLHYIIEEVEAKQIPGELALLPVIESAFKVHAYSHMHAAGLWQFIPSTGRDFGLQQNLEYDGRRDVYASTVAATLYLKQLAQKFDGDWLLGLASYNTGASNVAKAIRRNKKENLPTDFWSLSLHRETMAYVPRLLAIAKIFANASDYNLTLLPIANEPVFTAVDIGSQLDIAKAAELAELSVKEIEILNPAFNKQVSTPREGPHRLLIPVEKVEVFIRCLVELPDALRVAKPVILASDKQTRYRIKRGDSLGLIAQKHHISVSAIRVANRLKNNRIYLGKILVIPAKKYAKIKTRVAAQRRARKRVYRVQKGDNLWSISHKFSVTIGNLMHWNKLTKKSILKLDQKLVLFQKLSKNSSDVVQYSSPRKNEPLISLPIAKVL